MLVATFERDSGAPPSDAENKLSMATWNIGAVNNNPFEYWVVHDDPTYDKLMTGIQDHFDADVGHDSDVSVETIFTHDMFEELMALMAREGWAGVEETRQRWVEDLRQRGAISGLLKDRALGDKRLMSMPDRITNTIGTDIGRVFRPTPISSSHEGFGSVAEWWPKWKEFMFSSPLHLKGKDTRVVELLSLIPRRKYPALTAEEERISLPLQVLCLALFDAVLVNVVNLVSREHGVDWHALKVSLLEALVTGKTARVMEVLAQRQENDVVFLQETALSFPASLRAHPEVSLRYHVISAGSDTAKRDQRSVVLLRRERFPELLLEDLTGPVAERARSHGAEVADGDLVAVLVADKASEQRLMLASFHGDTNGLMTVPVAKAIHELWQSLSADGCGGDLGLFVGMDANTHHVHHEGKKQGVHQFYETLNALPMENGSRSSLRSVYHGSALNTTFNMRTALQPQLQKAVRRSEVDTSPLVDRNPKDHILYLTGAWEVAKDSLLRDNTGERRFTPDIMPSLRWPSDHAMTSAAFLRAGACPGKSRGKHPSGL